MSTEPERNIEKQLKAYAAKRRAESGEPIELHQTTRNLLQAEVARNRPGGARHGSSLTWLAGLWPRLAMGLSAFAVLSLGTWMALRSPHATKPTFELAQSAAPARATDAHAPNSLEPIGQDPNELKLQSTLAFESPREDIATSGKALAAQPLGEAVDPAGARSDSLVDFEALKPASTAAPQLADAPKTDADKLQPFTLNPSVNLTKVEAVERYGLPGVAPTSSFAVGKELNQWSAGLTGAGYSTQQFRQIQFNGTNRSESSAPPEAVVLTAFQVEQSGDRIRMIDQDGSIYAGILQKSDQSISRQIAGGKDTAVRGELRTRAPVKVQVFPTDRKSAAEAEQDYYFRVAGLHRGLNQKVVFTGHLVLEGNELDKVGVAGGAPQQNKIQNTAQSGLLQSNARISGSAIIGESRTIEIQAVPVKP